MIRTTVASVFVVVVVVVIVVVVVVVIVVVAPPGHSLIKRVDKNRLRETLLVLLFVLCF